MASEKHIFLPGRYYHVYNRGNERRDIFFERENYLFFLRRLGQYAHQTAVSVIAYCLMPNHLHLLLLQNSDIPISKLISSLATSYAKAINKRYARVGHLFQERYKAKGIDTTGQLIHLSRYIHINPVIAGLVRKPEDWEFSSYRDYICLRNGKLPKMDVVLSEFESVETYKEFVLSYINADAIRDLILEEE